MKKLSIYLSIIIVLAGLLYFIDWQTKQATNKKFADEAQQLYSTAPGNLNEATRKQLTDPNYQNIILPNELEQKLANGEDAYVYFFSPLCTYCIQTTPKLNQLAADAGVTIHQYNVLEFEEGWSKYRIEATPTLIYFQDGQAAGSVVGGYSGNAVEDSNKEAQYIQFFNQFGSSGS